MHYTILFQVGNSVVLSQLFIMLCIFDIFPGLFFRVIKYFILHKNPFAAF